MKKDKKKIALMNYVFRKSGMLVRIYARHIHMYQTLLDSIPEEMKKNVMKAIEKMAISAERAVPIIDVKVLFSVL